MFKGCFKPQAPAERFVSTCCTDNGVSATALCRLDPKMMHWWWYCISLGTVPAFPVSVISYMLLLPDKLYMLFSAASACAELAGGVCCLSLKTCSSATCACASLARPLLQLLRCQSHLSSKVLQSREAANHPASASSRSINLGCRRRLQAPHLLWRPPEMVKGLRPGSALLNPRLLFMLLLR